jgi:hypothetical protein
MIKSDDDSSGYSFGDDDIEAYVKFADEKIEQYEESINNCYVNVKAAINYLDEEFKSVDLTSNNLFKKNLLIF